MADSSRFDDMFDTITPGTVIYDYRRKAYVNHIEPGDTIYICKVCGKRYPENFYVVLHRPYNITPQTDDEMKSFMTLVEELISKYGTNVVTPGQNVEYRNKGVLNE